VLLADFGWHIVPMALFPPAAIALLMIAWLKFMPLPRSA
jgi:hypothetical protein